MPRVWLHTHIGTDCAASLLSAAITVFLPPSGSGPGGWMAAPLFVADVAALTSVGRVDRGGVRSGRVPVSFNPEEFVPERLRHLFEIDTHSVSLHHEHSLARTGFRDTILHLNEYDHLRPFIARIVRYPPKVRLPSLRTVAAERGWTVTRVFIDRPTT